MANHPTDDPTTCCPVCHGEGSLSADAVSQLTQARAEIAALREFVAAVDEWAVEAEGGCICERCVELRAARAKLKETTDG